MIDTLTMLGRPLDFVLTTGGYRLADLCEKHFIESGHSLRAGQVLKPTDGDGNILTPWTIGSGSTAVGVLVEAVDTTDGQKTALVLVHYAILNGDKLIIADSEAASSALNATTLIVRVEQSAAPQ